METIALKRVFIAHIDKEEVRLADPNPNLTPEEVMDHYSGEYPKLQNAIVLPGEVKGDIMEFEVKDNFGDTG